jgi:hypothetical protein
VAGADERLEQEEPRRAATTGTDVRALRTLLTGIVDYAGLFPPAALEMADAVRRYATYRRGAAAWMLGRFVVPLGRLDELHEAAQGFLPVGPGAVPWRLSGLAGDALSPDDLAAVARFDERHRDDRQGRAAIDSLEVKTPTGEDVARAASLLAGQRRQLACEVPLVPDPAPLLGAVRSARVSAKFRTGGVVPEAIPSAADLARGIWRASLAGVPFKATAGLHHPLRGEYPLTYEPDGARATMHGFLNVFLAGALAGTLARERSGAAAEEVPQVLIELLEERDPGRLRIEPEAIAWREHRIALESLEQARRSAALSFGSCSFEEPVDDLRRLGLLGGR